MRSDFATTYISHIELWFSATHKKMFSHVSDIWMLVKINSGMKFQVSQKKSEVYIVVKLPWYASYRCGHIIPHILNKMKKNYIENL